MRRKARPLLFSPYESRPGGQAIEQRPEQEEEQAVKRAVKEQ